jgi:hypothetical protein
MVRGVCLAVILVLAGDVPSGPQVGDSLKDFKVHAFSGNDAGKDVDVLKKLGNQPILLIFVHKITRPALRFLRPVDDHVSKENKQAAQVVWLAEDKEKTLEYLKRAQSSLNLKMPIGVSLDGKDGPGTYGLNDKVTLTILLAREQKVLANFALVDPNETDAPKVIAALDRLLGKK